MTQQVQALFADLDARALIAQQVADHVAFSQKDIFFRLAAAKSARVQALKARFAGKPLRRVFVSHTLRHLRFEHAGVEVGLLPADFFHAGDADDFAKRAAALEDALVVVNNNDVGPSPAAGMTSFENFFAHCNRTVFLGWDWDNHHWMERTLFLAAHSDLYFPAHNENMYLLSRINWLLCGPVPCGTIQWTRDYLAAHLANMLKAERRNEPLGMHVFYPTFKFRNQAVATIAQHFETVNFSTAAFHHRTQDDRLVEWYSHKSHWIAPVLNDIPIRLFDALATGGIPIVPQSMGFLAPVSTIPREHIVFYMPEDIVAPQRVVARAQALFDKGGVEGVARRHRYAMEAHHGDTRLATMLQCACEALDAAW